MDNSERLSRWRTLAAVVLGSGLTALGVAGGISEASPDRIGAEAIVVCEVAAVADRGPC